MNGPLDIARLIAKGESQTVEFKKSLSEQKEGLQALCGMLNSDVGQGMVLFGVSPDGVACGVEPGNLDKAQRSLSQHVGQKFDPPIAPVIETIMVGNAAIVLVRTERSQAVPYHEYGGRAYIRSGTETRALLIAEKDDLRNRRGRDSHNGPWKCNRCGSQVGFLASYEFTDNKMCKTYRCDCGGEFWPA